MKTVKPIEDGAIHLLRAALRRHEMARKVARGSLDPALGREADRATNDLAMASTMHVPALLSELADLRARVAGAEEILAKLPKTRDDVPIPPHDPVWHPEFLQGQGKHAYLFCDPDTGDAVSAYKDFARPIGQCYSTRELAEAAAK